MLRFLATRLARAALTIAMVVTFAFVVLRLSGDPAQIIMGADAPPEAVDAFRAAWGLDEPIWVQYFSYFWAILQGDLGRSMRDGRDAIVLVTERIPATLRGGLYCAVLCFGAAACAGFCRTAWLATLRWAGKLAPWHSACDYPGPWRCRGFGALYAQRHA